MNPPPIEHETWLAKRVGIVDLFDGITSVESRRLRIAERMVSAGLQDHPLGHDTYGSAFARLYGCEVRVVLAGVALVPLP